MSDETPVIYPGTVMQPPGARFPWIRIYTSTTLEEIARLIRALDRGVA